MEIKLRNTKYVLVAGYCPHKEMAPCFLVNISRVLDNCLKNMKTF